jgi:hypothetical protein
MSILGMSSRLGRGRLEVVRGHYYLLRDVDLHTLLGLLNAFVVGLLTY